MNYLTEPLNTAHKKQSFDCGIKQLNDYLHVQAKQDVKRRLSTCFILAGNEDAVKGYYTLSSAAVQRELLPAEIIKKLPPSYTNLPATLLGRLAVDNAHKGQGLGELLLMDAIKRSYDTSLGSIGSMAILVDPIDDGAVGFYRKFGFILLPDSGKMFIAMETISKLQL